MTQPPITPLELPTGTARVILIGGTFDPPHRAHARMAGAARQRLDPDATGSVAVVLVPAARSPFKPAPRADDPSRVEMVRALAADLPGASVWTDEIDRASPGRPSYWVETLERAHAAILHAWRAGQRTSLPALWFLIGADQAIALHRWRSARRVLELARPLIVLRPPIDTPQALTSAIRAAGFWGEGEIADLARRIIPAPLLDFSATEARAALAAGLPPDDAAIPGPVRAVIERRGLYRPEP